MCAPTLENYQQNADRMHHALNREALGASLRQCAVVLWWYETAQTSKLSTCAGGKEAVVQATNHHTLHYSWRVHSYSRQCWAMASALPKRCW
jgi:hypothetical protein